VTWVEDTAGNYVDTAFITDATGLRGIGNRTGIMDLQSGPKWPYGPRDDVLPIWAHRHAIEFPAVVWQGGYEPCNMSRAFSESSPESYLCRPIMPTEPEWDAGTCASEIFSDKGMFSTELISHYPPRGDVVRQAGVDSPDVATFADMNPFDTISRATPPGDQPYLLSWIPAATVGPGTYVLRVEVAKELDFNASYYESRYPTSQCVWLAYGKPYRGQPSVIYEVPFTLGTTATTATLDYVGYSDIAGTVHPPDATITTDTPGSGASRLRVAIAQDSSTYRVRVTTRIEQDTTPPDGAGTPEVTNVEPGSAELSFTEPGDDADFGRVSGFDIRYRIGDTMSDAEFETAKHADAVITPLGAGQRQTLQLTQLSPGTEYIVGIRAFDNCKQVGPLVTVRFTTPTIEVGCGCRSSHPSGLLLVVLALMLRRRRR